jgi:HSP20 family molecular chaperone IbpA
VTRESTTASSSTGTTAPSTSLTETKKPDTEVARREGEQQQLVNVFQWPPKMEITPKSDSGPLSYTISLPPEMSNPDVSLHVLQPGCLCVDVSHTSKSENPFGFNEQRLSFSRTIPLPEGTPKENVHASLKEDGKLVITVQEGK